MAAVLETKMSYNANHPRRALIAAALAGATLLAACATPTPYRPAMGSGFNRTGFSDQQIETNRFRVAFAGNSLTERETVERYLLFRAAEVTLQSGNDYFVMADRDTDKQTRTYTTPGYGGWGGGFGGWGGGYWGPRWNVYGRGYGWRSWDPYWGGGGWGGGPWGNSFDIRTVDRYEAVAEIIVGKGRKPGDNVRAFDAHDVVNRLGPTIVVPQDRPRG